MDSIETCISRKDIVCNKEEIKCNNVIKQYKTKMINFDDIIQEKIKIA